MLAEDLEEAYARGVELLSDASKLDRRRREAERELAVVQAKLDERARSSYMAGPGWFMSTLVGADDPADALARLPLQRAVLEADLALVDQVSSAKAKLDSTRTRLSERLVDQALGPSSSTPSGPRPSAWPPRSSALRTMDRRVAALIEQQRRREEASQRAAFADYLVAARTAGTAPVKDGRASPAAAKAVAVALAQLGSPTSGAPRPSTFDCSGLTSFAYAAAGVTIPRVSGPSSPPTPACARSTASAWSPATWCSSPTTPASRAPSTTSACTSAAASWSRPLHRRGRPATSSIMRSSYAGAVRPTPDRPQPPDLHTSGWASDLRPAAPPPAPCFTIHPSQHRGYAPQRPL